MSHTFRAGEAPTDPNPSRLVAAFGDPRRAAAPTGAHPHPAPARPGHPPPGNAAAWRAVFSLSLGVFGLATAEFLPAALLTPIASGLGVSVGAAGQAVTTTAAAAALSGPLLLRLIGAVDRRTVVLALTVLLVGSDGLAAVAPTLPILLAARVGLGIALGGTGSLVAALCLRLVPAGLVSRAMAVVFSGMTAASLIAPAVGASIGAALSWRAAFGVAAIVGAVGLLAQSAFLPRLSPVAGAPPTRFGALLRRPPIAIGLGAAVLVIGGHFAGFTYVRPFAERAAHLDLARVSATLLLLGVGGFLGNVAGGVLAGRNARASAGAAAIVIAAATLTLLAVGPTSAAVTLAAAAIWGFGFGIFPISLQTWAVQTAPDSAEAIGALMMAILQVAIALGAVFGGVLVDRLGASGAIGFCGFGALVGGLGMLLFVRADRSGTPRHA